MKKFLLLGLISAFCFASFEQGLEHYNNKEYEKAVKIQNEACDLGNQLGCDNYKRLNEMGYQNLNP